MLIAMIMVPIVAMMQLGGVDVSQAADLKPTNLDLFKGTTIVGIISFLCLGIRLLWSTAYYSDSCQSNPLVN